MHGVTSLPFSPKPQHEWLIDRVASTEYRHLLEFFVQYFENSAVSGDLIC